jgi:hypothetical protein
MVKVESGFGEKFSALEAVLTKGREWADGNTVQKIAAHTVTPVLVVAAAALDVLAHAILAVGKTVGFAVNAIVYVCSGFNVEIHASLTPSQIFKHAYRSAMTLATFVVVSPLSIFSPSSALSLVQAVGLAEADAPKGKIQGFKDWWAGMPAGMNSFSAAKAKADYLAKGCWNTCKSAATWTFEGLKNHTWKSEHKTAVVIGAAVVAIGLGAAAYAGVLAQAGAAVSGAASAAWSRAQAAGSYVKSFFVTSETWYDPYLNPILNNPIPSTVVGAVGAVGVTSLGYLCCRRKKADPVRRDGA